jgi:RNA polymerase sigma factor (sigma-70 family)
VDTTTDDATLVHAAREGNKEAFALLLDRHWPLLLALCRRMMGNADLAQDVAQEAALQAFLSLDRLRRAEQFGSWLSGIGLNICRHWLRRRSHADTSWEELCGGRYYPERDLPDEDVGPEERAEMADLRARVQRAVADLPRGQRVAIVLFYLYGLSQTEVAAHLGIEVGAVKTRLHKARETLRERLWQLWEEQDVTTETQSPLVEMRVESVRKNTEQEEARHVIVLEEVGGPRYLLIWVGQFEARSIADALNKVKTERPLTFTFMANLLQAADVRLREVQVNRLTDEVFYAVAVVEGAGGVKMVDARPSDAINLAILTGAPIRVAPAVLDVAGIIAERQATRDENGQDVIEQTIRKVANGEVVQRSHLDPETLKPIRVLFNFRQERGTA